MYYISLFSSITLGLGPYTPIYLFYIGSVAGLAGIICYLFLSQSYVTAVICSSIVTFTLLYFAFMCAVMVSAIHNARKVNDYVLTHDIKLNLTRSEIKNKIPHFVEKIGGIEFLNGDSADFMDYLEEDNQATKMRVVKFFAVY